MQTDSDAQLTRAGLAGDRRALDAIYRRYRPVVAATARRLLREPADADDAIQETFLIVFQRLAQLSDPSALCGWIARIATTRAHRVFRGRRRARRVWLDDPQPVLDRQPSSAVRPDLLAELALVGRGLELPLALHAAWILRHAGGLELEDIAARCGCSLATVKRRLADAQALIDRHVDRHVDHARPGVAGPRRDRDCRGQPTQVIATCRPVSTPSRTRDQFREP